MIRNPLPTLESIRDSVMDIARILREFPRFDIVSVAVTAVASTDVDALVRSEKIEKLSGCVQLGGTTTDVPAIEYKDNKTMLATYSFGASTSGKQTYTFLLVGV